jgi:hypothetical protein
MRLFLLLALSAAAIPVFAQQRLSLDAALANAVSYFGGTLPRNTRLLALKVAAPSEALSEYASDIFTSRLFASGAFTLVEREGALLRGIDTESAYQLSGKVDDDSMAFIGHQSGAQALVSGLISRQGTEFRLTLKAASIEKAETLGVYTALLESSGELRQMVNASSGPSAPRPQWILQPLEGGRVKYENAGVTSVSSWYYDVGISTKTATEQRARQRAVQNVQANIAATIASDFKARLDITEYAAFNDTDVEDAARLIELAISNSIKTRIPRYEPLEWHIEKGVNGDGKEWYTAYVLVRFPRKDILEVVETIDPARVVKVLLEEAMKQKIIHTQFAGEEDAAEMIQDLQAAREYAKESIQEGLTGN